MPEEDPHFPAPDDLVTTEVVVALLGLSDPKQVQRMVARKLLRPFAYVSSRSRRFMVFRRSYIEGKRKALDELRAAEDALREE